MEMLYHLYVFFSTHEVQIVRNQLKIQMIFPPKTFYQFEGFKDAFNTMLEEKNSDIDSVYKNLLPQINFFHFYFRT